VNFARWAVRLYNLNTIAAGACLACFMIMFGLLTDVTGGLLFPMALPSMAIEGNIWAFWMLSPVYLLPIRLLGRRLLAE
jgi:hypothetical protein